jgi:hypothetical protein
MKAGGTESVHEILLPRFPFCTYMNTMHNWFIVDSSRSYSEQIVSFVYPPIIRFHTSRPKKIHGDSKPPSHTRGGACLHGTATPRRRRRLWISGSGAPGQNKQRRRRLPLHEVDWHAGPNPTSSADGVEKESGRGAHASMGKLGGASDGSCRRPLLSVPQMDGIEERSPLGAEDSPPRIWRGFGLDLVAAGCTLGLARMEGAPVGSARMEGAQRLPSAANAAGAGRRKPRGAGRRKPRGADLARIWRLWDARSASRGWKERLWDPRGWKEHGGCHRRQMLRARGGGSGRIARRLRGGCGMRPRGFGRTCAMHVLDAYTTNIISSRDYVDQTRQISDDDIKSNLCRIGFVKSLFL